MKHALHATVKFPQAEDVQEKLEKRLGRLHARQRLGIETDHEAQVENMLFSSRLIEGGLRLSGFYWQGRRNACNVRVKHNDIVSRRVPRSFDGFRILHLSDLHIEMSGPAMSRVLELLPGLEYDLCVLTGDYRGKTFGSFDLALAGMARLGEARNALLCCVLGNHDTIRMVPGLEGMGIRMLLNEN